MKTLLLTGIFYNEDGMPEPYKLKQLFLFGTGGVVKIESTNEKYNSDEHGYSILYTSDGKKFSEVLESPEQIHVMLNT